VPAGTLIVGAYAPSGGYYMRKAVLCIIIAEILIAFGTAKGGVVNPNISVIGQPSIGLTDDAGEPNRKRIHLGIGETEFMFDDYLNPYSRGTFILSLSEDGLELEEGFLTILRGMPGGLNLKGGKYRVGFGKLNLAHPHTNPFAEPFRVLSTYLPGDESYNETGISLSERIPMPGDISLIASLDWLQGNAFRREREVDDAAIEAGDPIDSYDSGPDRADETRPAFAGRLSGFVMAGERSGMEFGLSATQGTNNVAAGTRTRVFGADVKAKLWNSAQSYLVLQGELLKLDREDAWWDAESGTYASTKVSPVGGYVYADYNFSPRYNVGASYERFQDDSPEKIRNQAVGLFAGFALMEETTAFRLDWSHFIPGTPDGAEENPAAVNTFTLRMIYSMGPHKAHQF
jgi:hypothetical protein